MNFTHFLIGDTVRNIVVDWSWNDKLSRGERREFHSLSTAEIVEIIVDRRSRKGSDVIHDERSEFHSPSIDEIDYPDSLSRMYLQKTDLFDASEKWISFSFNRWDRPKHCRRSIYKRQIQSGRDKWIWLSLIDESLQIIVEDWSRKDRISRGEISELHLLSSVGLPKSFWTIDLEKTNVHSRPGVSEFHSPSIDGIVQNIVDDGSTNDKFI